MCGGHACTAQNDLLPLSVAHRDRETLWETAHSGNCSDTVKTIRWLFSQFHSCVLPFGYAALQGNVLFLTPCIPEMVGTVLNFNGCWRESQDLHNTKQILCVQAHNRNWLNICDNTSAIQINGWDKEWWRYFYITTRLCLLFGHVYNIHDQQTHEI